MSLSDDAEATQSAHAAACNAGASMYRDPATGLWAMTAVGLRDRGFCCGEGCRHCPFDGTPGEHPARAANLRRLGRAPR